jgi:hypothetical protein
VQCKWRAPLEFSDVDMVMATGHWAPKRIYKFMNGWIPTLTVNIRCNNDGKLLTNGGDTHNITFYVSSYTAKKQGKNFNISAVMANGYTYHTNHSAYINNLHDNQWLLVFHLVNAINHEQELAAVMVISYLIGWGDMYHSHHYTYIYWSSFVGALLKAFPELRNMSR